jgi:hypothetical protein
MGPRLSGEPEILHEIQDTLKHEGISIGKNQIRIILESVPEIFPEEWKNPGTFEQLSDVQQEAGYRITGDNPQVPIYGETVQRAIEEAISFRDRFGK